MDRNRPGRQEAHRAADGFPAYVARRLQESNDSIKNAVKDFYSARYGVRFVHRQLLLLQKNHQAELGRSRAGRGLLKPSLSPIPRCSLVLTGATNAGKSYFINELLEIPLSSQPIAPEFYQPCTERILLIQDDDALQHFGSLQEQGSDRGNVSLVESAPGSDTFREVARVHRDNYDALSGLIQFLVDRNQSDSMHVGGSFEAKGKDVVVRVSNSRDILKTGLQLVDFPGFGDGLTEVQKYVTKSMGFVNPTVCLWLLNKAVFKETYDTEYIRKLQEEYKDRSHTQFIVAVGQVDQDEQVIESRNKHDMNFYVKCVTSNASNMDRAMRRHEDGDNVFANRLRYVVHAGGEDVTMDLLGISTVTLQDVKEKSDARNLSEFQWLHLQNWLSLKEDIAMAIRNHTRDYVRRQRQLFDQELREFTFELRKCLEEKKTAHHQVRQATSKLKDRVTLSRDCLKEAVEDSFKRWRPEAWNIIREWDVEQENLNIKEMEYYKYNPRRQILSRLLNFNIDTKTKQLVVLTTDHTVHHVTRSFFDDFKRKSFNEKYSNNVNDLFARLQSIGYAAKELPKSLEKALDILLEFYEVQRLIEELFYSSFPNFFNERASSDGEEDFPRFIRSYVHFLIDSCLPKVKEDLLQRVSGKIDKLFEPSIRVLQVQEREAMQHCATWEDFHARIDRRILPYCAFLNMALSSLHWEFCKQRPDRANLIECVRRPGPELVNYARNLVEVKMLLDTFDERQRRHFVIVHSWRFDRQSRTIFVMKGGSVLRPVLDWLRSEAELSETSRLKKCYRFGLDVLLGLKAIHKQNFIIDDFSPENVFLVQGNSRALIDLDTMRSGPFAWLRLSESDIVPPIHVHPNRLASESCLSQVFDLFSYATILWFLVDGTGSSRNLPKAFLKASTCAELQHELRHETPLIPERCDLVLYERMRDCWNLTNSGLEPAIRLAGGLKEQLKSRLTALTGL